MTLFRVFFDFQGISPLAEWYRYHHRLVCPKNFIGTYTIGAAHVASGEKRPKLRLA